MSPVADPHDVPVERVGGRKIYGTPIMHRARCTTSA